MVDHAFLGLFHCTACETLNSDVQHLTATKLRFMKRTEATAVLKIRRIPFNRVSIPLLKDANAGPTPVRNQMPAIGCPNDACKKGQQDYCYSLLI
ncbi:hypothetical protein [Rhizobium sp. P44RR-XXIV]|uniref:hypothetical protein n=1 Tax=Rhizobium sp. P44RR-XXIV TaxID=1921145 RepID=UPI0010A9D1E0|nr:hypothetical protein [Rhizobium sp. P44RR-XXIV]TIX88803.1 hypothetical protein BSK43_019280 [Rhizobium sp. P44RR-XXIV]